MEAFYQETSLLTSLGSINGDLRGSIDGTSECRTVGVLLCTTLGIIDGDWLGSIEGTSECSTVGASLGTALEPVDGDLLGSIDGTSEWRTEGTFAMLNCGNIQVQHKQRSQLKQIYRTQRTAQTSLDFE